MRIDVRENILELISLNAPGEVEVLLVDETSFFDDLGYDSLALISLLADLEEEYQLEFDDMEESLRAFENVGLFLEFVEKYMYGSE